MNRFLAFVIASWLGLDICPAPVNFDGTDDFVSVGDISSFFSDEATLSLWVKLDAATPSDAAKTGFADIDAISDPALNVSHYPFTNGLGYFGIFSSSGRPLDGVSLSGSVTRTSWHLVSIVTSPGAGNYILYQNATQVATGTGPASISVGSSSFFGKSSPTRFLDGQIQCIRLYNRALSAAEIETIYKSRIGDGNPVSSGLVAYWPLNDNSGNLAGATFVDRSGNGNSGTGSDAGGSGGQCSRGTFLTSP